MAIRNFGVWFCSMCDTVLLFDEEQGAKSTSGAVQKNTTGQLDVRCIICGSDMHRVPEAALAAFDALKAQRRREAQDRLGA